MGVEVRNQRKRENPHQGSPRPRIGPDIRFSKAADCDPATGGRGAQGVMEESTPAVELQVERAVSSDSLAPADATPRKRKGKSTRWNIPKHALQTLEQVFTRDKFPTVETRKSLAVDLKVTPRQVQVWFQNKRQRSVKPLTKTGAEPQQQMLSTSVSAAPKLLAACATRVFAVSLFESLAGPGLSTWNVASFLTFCTWLCDACVPFSMSNPQSL